MMTEMPKIRECDVKMCGYNKEDKCHAMAINVGGSGPICDAFVEATAKCGETEIIGGVGACKVKDCRFNDCLMCSAAGIDVKWYGSQAMCETFKKR